MLEGICHKFHCFQNGGKNTSKFVPDRVTADSAAKCLVSNIPASPQASISDITFPSWPWGFHPGPDRHLCLLLGFHPDYQVYIPALTDISDSLWKVCGPERLGQKCPQVGCWAFTQHTFQSLRKGSWRIQWLMQDHHLWPPYWTSTVCIMVRWALNFSQSNYNLGKKKLQSFFLSQE